MTKVTTRREYFFKQRVVVELCCHETCVLLDNGDTLEAWGVIIDCDEEEGESTTASSTPATSSPVTLQSLKTTGIRVAENQHQLRLFSALQEDGNCSRANSEHHRRSHASKLQPASLAHQNASLLHPSHHGVQASKPTPSSIPMWKRIGSSQLFKLSKPSLKNSSASNFSSVFPDSV